CAVTKPIEAARGYLHYKRFTRTEHGRSCSTHLFFLRGDDLILQNLSAPRPQRTRGVSGARRHRPLTPRGRCGRGSAHPVVVGLCRSVRPSRGVPEPWPFDQGSRTLCSAASPESFPIRLTG